MLLGAVQRAVNLTTNPLAESAYEWNAVAAIPRSQVYGRVLYIRRARWTQIQ
jgi:hypothetical protein